jgi:signal transduction histidine kinase
VTIDSDVPVQVASLLVDEPKIIRALLYLVRNAMEQAAMYGPHRMRVTAGAGADGVEIAVDNAGPPVPECEREAVFGPFYTTKGAPHLGLGLTHARAIARRHGGDVVYQEGRGFVLRLPRVTALETA